MARRDQPLARQLRVSEPHASVAKLCCWLSQATCYDSSPQEILYELAQRVAWVRDDYGRISALIDATCDSFASANHFERATPKKLYKHFSELL